MKTLNVSVAALALVGATSAMAMSTDFDTLDADGNGVISMEEASVDAKIAEQFEALDTDGNGKLSKGEFSKAQ